MIGTTKNANLLMSDYGHHPTEIIATLDALKNAYPDRKLIVFLSHISTRAHTNFERNFRIASEVQM